MKLNIRQPAVAGSFYPDSQKELKLMLKGFFDQTKKVFTQPEKIRALIVPHAGYIYSGQTAAWGYRQLPEKATDQHFVLIGPSHFSAFDGLACSSADYWQTPLGKIKHLALPSCNDRYKIVREEIPHLREHSLEVQLPFLQFLYQEKFSFSAFLTGYHIEEKKAAEFFLKNYWQSIFVFSSDLSHYLPDEEARKKDKKTVEAIIKNNREYLLTEDNAACGRDGLLILMEMAKKNHWQRKIIFYDTSATASGDYSAVVGYSSIIFYED